MRLTTKFTIFIGVSVVIIAGALSVYAIGHKRQAEILRTVGIIEELSRQIYDLNFMTYDFLLEPSERSRSQWLQQHDRSLMLLGRAGRQLIFEKDLLDTVHRDFLTLSDIFLQLSDIDTIHPGPAPEPVAEQRQRLAAQLLISSRVLYGKSMQLQEVMDKKIIKKHQTEDILNAIFLAAIVVILFGTITSVALAVYPGLKALLLGFTEISRGKLDYRIHWQQNDEIGSLIHSFNETVAKLDATTVSRTRLANEIQAKNESLQQLELVERALSESHDSVLMFDADNFSIFFANRGIEIASGYDTEALLAKQLPELIHNFHKSITAFLNDIAAKKFEQILEVELIHRDNTMISMEAFFQYIPEYHGQSSGYFIFVGRDITDRKKTERQHHDMQAELEMKVRERTRELHQRMADSEQLNRAMVNLLEDLQDANKQLESTKGKLIDINKELESFSYSVSHDLRAPLRHMSGFVHLLDRHAAAVLDEQGRRYIEIISKSASKLGRLIDDLLHFSRTGRAELKKIRVDNVQLVRETIEELSPDMEGRRVDWQIEPLPPVYADATQMKLIWSNLIGNAVKFTANRETAVIKVSSRPGDSGNTVYMVQDNGAGFDMRYKDKLFGVFQRLHRDNEFSGTGIGLATVQRIIHRHNGRVWAEGEIDRGAAFYFTLPTKIRGPGKKGEER